MNDEAVNTETALGQNVPLSDMLGAFVSRFTGCAYPVRDIKETQAIHGRNGAHVEAEWTTCEHWAHDNYGRSHLPQLCIRASGWKARLIALILWPKAPWKP